jgi:hypothetical protein
MEVRARWLAPCYWHDDIGKCFLALMQDVDGLLPGRRTYVIHAEAVEPMLPGDPFGDAMNAPRCPHDIRLDVRDTASDRRGRAPVRASAAIGGSVHFLEHIHR